MKHTFLLAVVLLAGIYLLSCQPKAEGTNEASSEATASTMTKADSIKRGEYLSHIMGCNDCHTPKLMTDRGPVLDTTRMLSGHPADEVLPKITDKNMIGPGQWILFSQGQTAAVGPWGTSFSANLTPDETGTGSWTLENFNQAIRHGKFKGIDGGRMIMPPMPWQTYSTLSDEDLANLWIYLRSLKPVKNIVPAYIPPSQG